MAKFNDMGVTRFHRPSKKGRGHLPAEIRRQLTLDAKAGALRLSMNTPRIDDAILCVAEPSWRKVAMIIGKTSKVDGIGVPDDEEGHKIIASRIEALVCEGRLVAQGNLKRWRYSEVRLP